MRSRYFTMILLSVILLACAREQPALPLDHRYMRADGSGFDDYEGHLVIYVPNWQRGFPFCENAWNVGSYFEHGHCSAQENSEAVEITSGEPVTNYEPPPQMSDRHLKRLLRWRNHFDRPFSMFVLGPDHSREAKYKYSIRLAFGNILYFGSMYTTWGENFELNDDIKSGYSLGSQTKSWAVRNLSEYAARDWEYFVAELFAWYTAPWYEKGSLPVEVEDKLERMANFSQAEIADHPALSQMKAALARARQAEPCNCYVENPFMAHDELTFLYIWRWEYHFNASWPTYDKYAVPLCRYPTSHPSYESSCNKRD